MAENKVKIRNCTSLFWWITRPERKMNNSELKVLGSHKRFAKRLTSKKRRAYLKSKNNEEEI